MRTGQRTGGASGAGCFDEPRPGSWQRPRSPGRRLCRGGGSGLWGGGLLRPFAPVPPGQEEPAVGGGVGYPVLVRRMRLYSGLYRLGHGGRGGGLRPHRHSSGRRGLLFASQPSGEENRGLFGLAGVQNMGFLHPSHPPGRAGGKKILDFFEKSLSFFPDMVYNNRETWTKVRWPRS